MSSVVVVVQGVGLAALRALAEGSGLLEERLAEPATPAGSGSAQAAEQYLGPRICARRFSYARPCLHVPAIVYACDCGYVSVCVCVCMRTSADMCGVCTAGALTHLRGEVVGFGALCVLEALRRSSITRSGTV